MLLAKWVYSVIGYLRGPPPVNATFNTNINVFVDSTGHARKKRKTGMDRIEWILKCNDEFPKPVCHEKALRSNVTMKKRTLAAVYNDTNERSHLHRDTVAHPENYFQ